MYFYLSWPLRKAINENIYKFYFLKIIKPRKIFKKYLVKE